MTRWQVNMLPWTALSHGPSCTLYQLQGRVWRTEKYIGEDQEVVCYFWSLGSVAKNSG